jgi:hypothetical protein
LQVLSPAQSELTATGEETIVEHDLVTARVPYKEVKAAFRPESLLPMKVSETKTRQIMRGVLGGIMGGRRR